MKYFSSLWVWLAIWVGVALPSQAQTPDATFAPSGLYSTSPAYQVLEQVDGKVVVLQSALRVNGAAVSGFVQRFSNTGVLDAAFGQNIGSVNFPDEVVMLPNNQLLLRGSYGLRAGGISRNELLRLNADGTADSSLDAGTGVGPAADFPFTNSVVVQPDGKMVLAGFFNEFSGVPTHHLVRLNPNGTIDPSFQLATGPNEQVFTVMQQADGKFLIGGTFTSVGGVVRPGLARLLNDGTLDTSFVPPLLAGSQVDAVRVQPDGNVLVAGFLNPVSGNTTDFVRRLTPSGALDNSFATPSLNSNLAAGYGLNPFQLQPDGKIILIGGFTQVNGQAWPQLVRLNANGTVDASFNPGAGPNSSVVTAALGNAGKLYVGGFFNRFAGQVASLVRLLPSGAPDNSFNIKLQNAGQVNALVRQADGKIIIGGNFTELNNQPAYGLARLNPTGTPDLAYAPADEQPFGVLSLALQADGKLLAGASTSGFNTRIPALRRLTSTGTPDGSFVAPFSGNNFTVVVSLAVQPDGRILVGGNFAALSGGGAGLVRLLTSGQVDAGFVPSSPAGLGQLTRVQVLTLQPDGRVVAAGQFSGTGGTSHVFRLTANGSPDNGFNAQNTFSQGNNFSTTINTVEVQPGGAVLVGGQFALVNGAPRTSLLRLNSTGQLDAAFNANAVLTANSSSTVHKLLTQPNGRILVGGFFSGAGLSTNLARLLPDGRPDPSFTTPLGIGRIRTLAVEPDGKLLAGGFFTNVQNLPYIGVVRLDAPNVLNVNRQQSAASLQAWPVPARGSLHLRLDAAARPQHLTLLNALGQPVLSQPVRQPDLILNTALLAPGAYLLRVEYADVPVMRRVILE